MRIIRFNLNKEHRPLPVKKREVLLLGFLSLFSGRKKPFGFYVNYIVKSYIFVELHAIAFELRHFLLALKKQLFTLAVLSFLLVLVSYRQIFLLGKIEKI